MRMSGKGFMNKPHNASLLERSGTAEDDYLTQQSFDRGDLSLDGSPGGPIGMRQPFLYLQSGPKFQQQKKISGFQRFIT